VGVAFSPEVSASVPKHRVFETAGGGTAETPLPASLLAGRIAIDPKTNQLMSNASIEDQTHRVLDNLTAVLAADGLTMDHVVSTTVFLKDMNEFEKINGVYATYFENALPARTTVEVARLPLDAQIEISAIAVAP
jgi:2-iminobutanoate/2-iminopropanoate deaminase